MLDETTMENPARRFPSHATRQALAQRFDLPIHEHMQDWEWEVADCAHFDEFLLSYTSEAWSDDERFSLMEILVQCVEEMPSSERHTQAWGALEPLLRASKQLHHSTISYWALLDEGDVADCFKVSAKMRELLQ